MCIPTHSVDKCTAEVTWGGTKEELRLGFLLPCSLRLHFLDYSGSKITCLSFSNLKLAFLLKVEEPSCFEDKIDEIIQTKMNTLSCVFSGHAYFTLFSNPEIGNAAHLLPSLQPPLLLPDITNQLQSPLIRSGSGYSISVLPCSVL